MKTRFFSSIVIVMVLGLVSMFTFKTSHANTSVNTYMQDGSKYGKDPESCNKLLPTALNLLSTCIYMV